jgi:hypothetical protein
MAQPYTARQLGFFKTTLKILESAILDAELLAREAETLQKMSITPIMTETTSVIDDDTQGAGSSYFSVLPELVDASQSGTPIRKSPAAPVTAVTTLPSVKNSGAFFQSLPWQNGVSRVVTDISKETTVVTPVDSHTAKVIAALDILAVVPENAKNSATYFRSLPWKGVAAKSPAAIVQAVTDNIANTGDIINVSPNTSVASELAQAKPVVNNTCAAFFQSLPWDNTVHTPLATSVVNHAVVDKPIAEDDDFATRAVASAITANQSAKNTSAGFFRSLPWQGQAHIIDSSKVLAAMDSDDFASIANLATQTALNAAQRGSGEYNVPTPQLTGRNTASGFFQTLPW